MTLKSANQPIRWMARIGTRVTNVWRLVLIGVKASLDFKEEDGFMTKGGKTAGFAARRALYLYLDYGLWAVSVAIFMMMKTMEFSFLAIFIGIWAYEFCAAAVLVFIYEKTRQDISLGADFRRARDAVSAQSRVAGYLVTLVIIGMGIVWTGPEKIVIFFRKELETVPRVVKVILVLTEVQALVWTGLYTLGYGLVVELF